MGVRPIRDMCDLPLPDVTDDFAAETFAIGALARHQSLWRRQNGDPQSTPDAGNLRPFGIDTQTRLADTLQLRNDGLLVFVAQRQAQGSLRIILQDFDIFN